MPKTAPLKAEYIQESNDPFLKLFPHRFDYIVADYPDPGHKPAWQTERRHPLSDRLLVEGGKLFGVRFGSTTRYCLLDIDIDSPYHPRQDPQAIAHITAALEPLELVNYIACTSSNSGGLHLYFPFTEALSSWKVAAAVTALLEHAGFKPCPGRLEVFPNAKQYVADGQFQLFNAHRLPLQIGSYLLNQDWEPIWTNRSVFTQVWQQTQQHNLLTQTVLDCVLKQTKPKVHSVSQKANKFINDLDTEIELGWTGPGQTNRLLGRITMRTYIFQHILGGGNPLTGQPLIKAIVDIAKSLPGYLQWCNHQHEIEKRATDWAHCIENSHYYHYGQKDSAFKPEPATQTAINQLPTWNEQQQAGARERIRQAIAYLLETKSLPTQTTARFQALVNQGIGGSTLYRHRDLWHPTFLQQTSKTATTNTLNSKEEKEEETENDQITPSLFDQLDRNASLQNGSKEIKTPQAQSSGRNSATDAAHDARKVQAKSMPNNPISRLLHRMKQPFNQTQAQKPDAVTGEQCKKHAENQVAYQKLMQDFLNSGDPVLIAEAHKFLKRR